ncbi:sensor histidine kinase [Jatrophihabitans sp. YIM 134969]
MKHEFVRRVRLLVAALAALVSSVLSFVLGTATVVALPLFGVWVGLPLFAGCVWATRRLTGVTRQVLAARYGYDLPVPYLRPGGEGVVAALRTTLRDPATWRDLAWLVLDATVGLTLAVLAVVEALLDLLFWFLPAGLSLRLSAGLGALLLGPTETARLAVRVDELAQSRAETVDVQAAELRRIERDLHDGAQARLISLGMSLALAQARFDDDPPTARALIGEALEASRTAVAELSDLVRGIHPPVLADRGLAGAVQALALTLPGDVSAEVDVPARLPAPVESAAYFATAEALTNAVKHSGARRVRVSVVHRDEQLRIVVEDDGRGGADPSRGSGLRGIQRRLSAFDGSLAVVSPVGGPTRLEIALPAVPAASAVVPSGAARALTGAARPELTTG